MAVKSAFVHDNSIVYDLNVTGFHLVIYYGMATSPFVFVKNGLTGSGSIATSGKVCISELLNN